jgi:antibiotic biosynthesis monooxygenase (ABM) superfamily enzyme
MYRLVRTVRIKVDKAAQAYRWAKEGVDLITKKTPGHDVEANIEVYGTHQTIHWTATFADLGDLQAWEAKLEADSEYMAWGGRRAEFMVEGSMHDILMQSL